jgi:hypothetical protein
LILVGDEPAEHAFQFREPLRRRRDDGVSGVLGPFLRLLRLESPVPFEKL